MIEFLGKFHFRYLQLKFSHNFQKEEELVLYDLQVRGLRLSQLKTNKAVADEFVSSIINGSVQLSDISESVDLNAHDPLLLSGVNGRISELRINNVIRTRFDGVVEEIFTGPEGFRTDLRPTVLQHLDHQTRHAAVRGAHGHQLRTGRIGERAQEIEDEEHRLAANDSPAMAAYVFAISNKIYRNWSLPASAKDDLLCVVNVRQIAGGEVVGVKIISCNGDEAVERSIEAAIRRSSPLPEPSSPDLFRPLLELHLVPKQ